MSKCIYCKSDLNESAIFCHKCNHYQSPLRNFIPHIGVLVVIITLLGMGISPIRKIYTNLMWEDEIEIINFSSYKNVIVKNIGSGDVFIEDIYFESLDLANKGFNQNINKIVKKNEFFVYQFPGIRPDIDIVEKGYTGKQIPILLHPDDVLNDSIKVVYKDPLTFKCKATIRYRSLKNSGRKIKTCPCIGYIGKEKSSISETE